MRTILKALTVFNWVTPTLDLIEDVVVGGKPYVMDDANYLKAQDTLKGVNYRGGHNAGTFSNIIMIDDADVDKAERQLNLAGVVWK